MYRFRRRFLGLATVLALACVISGCGRNGKDHITLTAQVLGREYTAEIEGTGHLYPSGLVTTVKFGNNHQLGIEKERLLLDGKECAKIRAEAQRFNVVYANQTLTVKVDRSTVFASKVSDDAPETKTPTDAEVKK